MHNALDATPVTQSVQVHQRLGGRPVFLLVTVCHVDLLFLSAAVSETVHSFTERNLTTQHQPTVAISKFKITHSSSDTIGKFPGDFQAYFPEEEFPADVQDFQEC